MERLGHHLAVFYSLSERTLEIDRYGCAETIGLNMEENFRQLEPFVPNLVERSRFEFVREASRGFFLNSAQLFERRKAEGRICDGHGDLRAEHVYFLDRIQIIDCIEFNERFRYGDVAIDLAFLHMDMERLGHDDLSLAMIKAYTGASRDGGIYALLDFYSCYRAIVKMKVSCLNWTELDEGARKTEMEIRAAQYLDLATRFAVQFVRPSLLIVCGLPGSGKSTLSKRLRHLFDTKLFMSDDVRRELPECSAHSGPVPYGQGIYRPEMRGRVYAHLLNLAQEELKRGRSVVLDATFTRRKWREEAVRLASDTGSNILFFECTSTKETLLTRLGRRRTGDGSLSDARPEHLPGLADELKSMDELAPEQHARVDTESDIESSLNEILARAYAMKRAQVVRAMDKL
jgi:predicted kinase